MELLETVFRTIVLILVVVAIFNVIIFVHELGHFLAAKWRGLAIDRFQIWFGKPIWKKEINGVQYGMGWIPAGGFVALPQMAPMEALEGINRDGVTLPPIKPLDKIIVAFAGPLFSFLLATVCAVMVWQVGKPNDFVPSTEIGFVEKGSPAEQSGLRVGDTIQAINGEPVNGFAGSLDSIMERIILSEGEQITFTVKRPGEEAPVEIVSGFKRPDSAWYQRSGLRQVGISPKSEWFLVRAVAKKSPGEKAGLRAEDRVLEVNGAKPADLDSLIRAIKAAGEQPVSLLIERAGERISLSVTARRPKSPAGMDPVIGVVFTESPAVDETMVHPGPFQQVRDSLRMMWVTIEKVVSPRSSIGVDHLSGPVGIAKAKFQLLQMKDGWRRVLAFMVLFNVNLAVLNMMPFPVLDGGHITLATLEAIARRPVQAKFLEVLQMAFAIALIGLMLYVTSKDIGDDIGRGGGGNASEVIFE